jgi:hypothetical protein
MIIRRMGRADLNCSSFALYCGNASALIRVNPHFLRIASKIYAIARLATALPIQRLKNWRFEILDGIKNLKSQTVQDATGTMVGCSTIAKTSLARAKLSPDASYKLKSQISKLKSVDAVKFNREKLAVNFQQEEERKICEYF